MSSNENKEPKRMSRLPAIDGLELQNSINSELQKIYASIRQKTESSTSKNEVKIALLETALESNIESKLELKMKYDVLREENFELSSKLITMEKHKVFLEKQLSESKLKIDKLRRKVLAKEWPNRICSIVIDIEAQYSMRDLVVCSNCATVHPEVREADCTLPEVSFPQEPKEKRIFNRKQRWMWFINQTNNPTAFTLSAKLKKYFDDVVLKPTKTPSEVYVASLEVYDKLFDEFCDSIARIFEFCCEEINKSGVIDWKLAKITLFTPPHDIFIAWLIDICSPIREDGDVIYDSPINPAMMDRNGSKFVVNPFPTLNTSSPDLITRSMNS